MSYGLKTSSEQGRDGNAVWEIGASDGFVIKIFVTMYGHMNLKLSL
jgi:hypothetical protein